MVKILWDALLDDDLTRVRLGRFSEADERMMEQLVRGRGRLFGGFGRGKYAVDLRAPGVFSTRPATKEGGQTFTFSHGWTRKRTQREVPKDRLYLMTKRGDGPALRAAGARFDNRVKVAGASGGWWVAPGRRAPEGASFALGTSVAPRRRGQLPGAAAEKQRYIERDGAVDADARGEITFGTIAPDPEARAEFWRQAEERERSDGRVQGQVIAELPYEAAVGPEGRRRIARAFGRVFDGLGLRWHAAVHKPDSHSDARNYHLHFLYYDRPAERAEDGTWRLGRLKSAAARKWGFIKDLRRRYAGIVNGELQRAGLYRRLDPRTYEAMGIPKEPGVHLGNAAAAMERKGVVTTRGRINYTREWFFRLHAYVDASMVEHLADRDAIETARPLAEAADRHLVPEVRRAADDLVRRATAFVDAAEEFQKARAKAEVTRWRGDDLAVRPGAAAENHEDSNVRREALEVATAVRRWSMESRRQARAESERAGSRARETRRRFREGRRSLEGELLLADRRTLTAERKRARERLEDGRLGERDWRIEGDGLAQAETAARERLKELGREVAANLKEAYGKEAGPLKEAALDRRRRKALAGRLKKDGRRDLAAAVARLTETENGLAEIEGRRAQRRRAEASPKGFKRRVRPASEEAELAAAISAAERAIDDVDAKIAAHGTAYRLAAQRGLAARLGRDGAQARQEARRAARPDRERE